VLNAAGGFGGIVGGIVAGLVINGRSRPGVAIAVASFAGATTVLGLTAIPALAAGATVVAVGALIMLDTLNMTTVQRLTADGGTGRAFGLLQTLAAAWMMAGALVPTLCLATLGIQAAIIVPAAVVIVLGGLSLALPKGSGIPVALPTGFTAART
jgi:hypothetical protein